MYYQKLSVFSFFSHFFFSFFLSLCSILYPQILMASKKYTKHIHVPNIFFFLLLLENNASLDNCNNGPQKRWLVLNVPKTKKPKQSNLIYTCTFDAYCPHTGHSFYLIFPLIDHQFDLITMGIIWFCFAFVEPVANSEKLLSVSTDMVVNVGVFVIFFLFQ